jgi:hypothetical protein
MTKNLISTGEKKLNSFDQKYFFLGLISSMKEMPPALQREHGKLQKQDF